MRSRDVIGKRIVKIVHQRWWNAPMKRMETTVQYMILEDGTALCPFAFETEDTPQATILHNVTGRRARATSAKSNSA